MVHRVGEARQQRSRQGRCRGFSPRTAPLNESRAEVNSTHTHTHPIKARTDANTLKPKKPDKRTQTNARTRSRADKKPFISSEKTITQLPTAVDGLIKSWRGLIFLDV